MLTFELVSMTLSNSIISTFAMVSFKQLLLLEKEESAEALSCEEMDHIYQTASMSAGVFFHIKEGKAGGYTPYLFVVLKKKKLCCQQPICYQDEHASYLQQIMPIDHQFSSLGFQGCFRFLGQLSSL